jgi:soluble lytic murein transglycosylase-like protein
VSKRARLVGLSIMALAAAQPAAAASARPPLAESAQRVESVVERDGTLYVTLIGPPDGAETRPQSTNLLGSLIEEIATRYAVSAKLVEAIISTESGFNQRAVSNRGALGLMQLMPATAAQLGVRDAFNARDNIEGGVRHLRGLIDQYAGDLRLALAAYNAGAVAVARYRGVPPYPETQSYVRRVLSRFDTPTSSPGRSSRDRVDTDGQGSRHLNRYDAADGTVVYTNLPAEWLPNRTQELLVRSARRVEMTK